MAAELDRTYPVWQQIAAIIAARVAAGEYDPAHRLPSVMEVSTEFDVATSTAGKAMTRLKEAGVIRRVQGLGTFVADNGPEVAGTEPFGPLPHTSA
ncbi:MAG: GntR family transcriptional regulator [Streptomyces sp.]|jgi:DNA-binding GntR family transcriptional regulator|nr:GntR family transcriptional regulator [Streptomyces sp.]